jgi:hypothetical protein
VSFARVKNTDCTCGEQIVHNYPNGTVKVRAKVLVFDPEKNIAFAVCRKCDREIEVPVKLVFVPPQKITHFIAEKDRRIVDKE